MPAATPTLASAPDLTRLPAMLTRLKLTAIRDQLDTLLGEAARRELTLAETVTYLCEREIARKDERRIEMALGLARFSMVRDLGGYDFAAQPAVDKQQIRELASGRFVANGEAVLLLGPPGVGKTHLAVGLGRAVITAGYTVLFTTATALIAQLVKAQTEGRQASAPHHRRAGVPARRAGRGSCPLPARQPALRTWQHPAYLLWPRGDGRDQAFLLGVLSSLPLDWYARRFVETHLNYFVFNPLPVPRPPQGSRLRDRVITLSARLAVANDDRFEEWGAAVGMAPSPLAADDKDDLIRQLDAAVAHLYGLSERDLAHIFETFHTGWDYQSRLEETLRHFRSFGRAGDA